MWEMYYKDAQAVIFVIDSADRLRMAVARDELEGILSHEDITKNNSLFLFFANKMDMADACSAAEASHLLDLPSLLKGKAFHIQASNALTGQFSGLFSICVGEKHIFEKLLEKDRRKHSRQDFPTGE